ncbi:MAG: hypothetical protein MPEBLZ_02998 [Candidatus Methanoperedens nitroreducens]|uniref:DUF1538 domain-containing protein n=1 Tax=Candidatus Methanoperedens nitratireducens TaxID=1392998 RepID=A0A0P8A774_9EURY|nr:DUF1538 domain-containing protein [Candidatus Methanoperedens sp. BLZ2]KAB2947994.1 MAG: DUF1538 domain-containing protein [Candidatus Methanoperedens sp.]KPQ42452.1 MAG: hypothetical protein MPEBLZ_02998 [Candidatus Methanoperedens sp. BLZ1]MBZ0176331.1 DUF1538 domain-containing protein [Candidatus Methanoperedens nitroreducens]MCX9080172.1 DUF1538 domain-containing protein [Candidatus Methanoperedens sp.]MCX9087987.1 DUF1538 domain-containing protein [Candidatus Methanoperedens sp.]
MALSWLKASVIAEVVLAVLPVVIFMFAFQFFITKRPIENLSQILIGIALSTIGLILFLEGLELGFLPLGQQVGAGLPTTGSAYIVVAFASIFGYAVTLAEPNLRVLISQVETVSSGSIPGNIILHVVGIGVGVSLGISMLRILLGIPLWKIIVPGYLLALMLIYFAPAYIVPMAFDAGAVVTGPVVVPLILTIGVGLTSVLGGRDPLIDSFGLVATATLAPVLSLLMLGIALGE